VKVVRCEVDAPPWRYVLWIQISWSPLNSGLSWPTFSLEIYFNINFSSARCFASGSGSADSFVVHFYGVPGPNLEVLFMHVLVPCFHGPMFSVCNGSSRTPLTVYGLERTDGFGKASAEEQERRKWQMTPIGRRTQSDIRATKQISVIDEAAISSRNNDYFCLAVPSTL
jgi:hypothetical protein